LADGDTTTGRASRFLAKYGMAATYGTRLEVGVDAEKKPSSCPLCRSIEMTRSHPTVSSMRAASAAPIDSVKAPRLSECGAVANGSEDSHEWGALENEIWGVLKTGFVFLGPSKRT
jgi:hypothetical protein